MNVNQTSFPGVPVSHVLVELSLIALKVVEVIQIFPEEGIEIACALIQSSFETCPLTENKIKDPMINK